MDKELTKVEQMIWTEQEEEQRKRDLMMKSRAKNTRRAYRADWAEFMEFCEERGFTAMPSTAKAVSSFILHLLDSGRKASTISRKMTSIGEAHKTLRAPNPVVDPEIRSLLAGIKRTIGTKVEQKAPLMTEIIKQLLTHVENDKKGKRDKALLLVGYAGGFRRNELTGIMVEDITFVKQGVAIDITKSKTDQEKMGRRIGVPYGEHLETCPVTALKEWLKVSGIKEGYIFRGMFRGHDLRETRLDDKMVSAIIKELVVKAGLDETIYSGHSLRSGMVTQASSEGASEYSIMLQTGHTNTETLRRYIRSGRLFKDNAAYKLGL